MAKFQQVVPDLGVEGEVEVVEVMLGKGDIASAEDPLLVLESDKATMEIPLDKGGKIISLSVKVGDKVKQGDLLAELESTSDSEDVAKATEAETSSPESVKQERDAAEEQQVPEDGVEPEEETVCVPDLGGAESVDVIEVQVKEGDRVKQDDVLIVLESDKATMEIPSPATGVWKSTRIAEGDKLKQGDVIGTMTRDAKEEPRPQPTSNEQHLQESTVEPEKPKQAKAAAESSESQNSGTSARVYAGPAVRKLAREMGVDLNSVEATGPHGRIQKDDVKAYVKRVMSSGQTSSAGASMPAVDLPDFSQFGDIEERQMSKLHVMTARNMQRSWSTVPHVTQFDQADITDLEAFRKSKKSEADERNCKLTILPFLLKACAYALQQLPQFNVSINHADSKVIQKHYIHIGLAVDTPAGLLVPVIRDVDKKTVWDLAKEVQVVAEKARDRKLQPSDMQGACFTISSLGAVGGTAFTPIVNTPEVAILGVSKASMQPVYDADQFVPRLMLPLSLSYDHRAVNGVDGAKFTSLLSRVLADVRELLL